MKVHVCVYVVEFDCEDTEEEVFEIDANSKFKSREFDTVCGSSSHWL